MISVIHITHRTDQVNSSVCVKPIVGMFVSIWLLGYL